MPTLTPLRALHRRPRPHGSVDILALAPVSWIKPGTQTFQNANGTTAATANGHNVKYLGDQSGLAHHMTGGADPPTLRAAAHFGKSLVRMVFNTTGTDAFRSTFSLAKPVTYCGVLRHRAWVSGTYLLDGDGQISSLYASPTEYSVRPYTFPSGTTGTTPVILPIIALTYIEETFDGVSSSLRIGLDGPTVAQSTDSTYPPNGLAFGYGAGGTGNMATADYGEWLVFDRNLSEGDRTLVRSYFKTNWFDIVTRQIVCLGDSLTHGQQGTEDNGYPSQLQDLRLSDVVHSYGYDARSTSQIYAHYAATILPLYNAGYAANRLISFTGTNDLLGGGTAVNAFNAIQANVSTAQGDGWDVWVVTLPASNYQGVNDFDTVRLSLNTMLRNAFPTRIIDFGADTRFDQVSDTTNGTYYNADQLHLMPPGYGVLAGLVDAALGA